MDDDFEFEAPVMKVVVGNPQPSTHIMRRTTVTEYTAMPPIDLDKAVAEGRAVLERIQGGLVDEIGGLNLDNVSESLSYARDLFIEWANKAEHAALGIAICRVLEEQDVHDDED